MRIAPGYALACALVLAACGDKKGDPDPAPAPPREAPTEQRPGPTGPEVTARKPLGVGATAPTFALEAHDGRTVDLAQLSGPVVLYFYPKDDTPG